MEVESVALIELATPIIFGFIESFAILDKAGSSYGIVIIKALNWKDFIGVNATGRNIWNRYILSDYIALMLLVPGQNV